MSASKPVCVITGDVHFTLQTLELASAAVEQAIDLAKHLGVPLVLNGDTLDSKAIIRGEIANRLITLLQKMQPEDVYVNTGNHDLLSEKGEASSLHFLRPYAQVVSRANNPIFIPALGSWLVPYFNDSDLLEKFLASVQEGSRLIVHQGVMGAEMGHYIKDSTSLPRECYSKFRVVASHYHKRQDIKCGRPRKGAVGLFSYVGNPYSLSFAESGDGPKGVNVLYEDGLLHFIPTNLRKHVIVEATYNTHSGLVASYEDIVKGDIVWVKLRGSASELAKITREDVGKALGIDQQFKLDKISSKVAKIDDSGTEDKTKSGADLMDKVIDATDEPKEQKASLKNLWRELAQK